VFACPARPLDPVVARRAARAHGAVRADLAAETGWYNRVAMEDGRTARGSHPHASAARGGAGNVPPSAASLDSIDRPAISLGIRAA
ncbi:MAG: hypothetical protein ACLQHS_03760, partial [Candidatus Limnocylindrales bacterium]